MVESRNPVLTNFPKLHSPFIRRTFQADREQLKKFLSENKMRPNYDGVLYLVTSEIDPEYAWVFDSKETIAVEKLDGTNVKIKVCDHKLEVVQNRLNPPINLLRIDQDNWRYAEGVFNALSRKYISEDGEYAGELLGPKVQSNRYLLDSHIWYPFDRTVGSLRYKSFDKYDRTFDNISSWFKDYLKSLFYMKYSKGKLLESLFAEGVIFYNLKRKSEGKSPWMAKLRRDMWRWYYTGVTISENPIEGPEPDEE
jgi:hypothetical protein